MAERLTFAALSTAKSRLIPVQEVCHTSTGVLSRFASGAKMPELERLRELADFLKTRRARLSPSQVGLPSGSRRRAAGLRREEVAELAGISVTWYTWLEQARPVNVSSRTVQNIARALKLSEDERQHLFQLAQLPLLPEYAKLAQELDQPVQSILHALGPNPAYALGKHWQILGWNEAADAVFKFSQVPAAERNIIRYIFTSPYLRKLLVNWEHDAQDMLAQFRVDYSQQVEGDEELESLARELESLSPEFKLWWSRHDVVRRSGWGKELEHPAVGRLEMTAVFLARVNDAFPRLVVYTPLPQTDTAQKLSKLLNHSI